MKIFITIFEYFSRSDCITKKNKQRQIKDNNKEER